MPSQTATRKCPARIEARRDWITEAIDWLADKRQWEKLRRSGVRAKQTAAGGSSPYLLQLLNF